jgi:cardiolipin synthase (CMP-forming)
MPRWLNLANLFTLLRLALVPLVVRAIVEGWHGQALALFLAAGFTDVLDGAAARRLGQATPAGAYLDPIADKCLLCGVFVALAAAKIVPGWFVVLVFGRDLYLLLAALILLLATPLRRFPPSRWGKASTFFQIATAVAWMVRNATPGPALDAAATALLWLSAALTLCSGIHYTWRGARLVRAH